MSLVKRIADKMAESNRPGISTKYVGRPSEPLTAEEQGEIGVVMRAGESMAEYAERCRIKLVEMAKNGITRPLPYDPRKRIADERQPGED